MRDLAVVGLGVIAVTVFLMGLVWVIGRAEEREERREAEEREREREAAERCSPDVPVLGGPELRRRAEESRGRHFPGSGGAPGGPW